MKYRGTLYGPEWMFDQPEWIRKLRNGEPLVLGNSIYKVCHNCKTVVKVNKTFFGSAHFCQ